MGVLFRSFFSSDWTKLDGSQWSVQSMWSNKKGKWTNSDGNEIGKPSFGNWFLIGVKSQHYNNKEDRKFQFFYAKSTMYSLGDCKTTSVSSYGQKLEVPNSGESLNWGKEYLGRY